MKTWPEWSRTTRIEKGAVRKRWTARFSVALVFSESYEVGMSNLGFQAVYSILHSYDHIGVERVFKPDSNYAPKAGHAGIRLSWMSEESGL